MEGWVKVFSSPNQIEADFIVGLLNSNEIPTHLISKKDSWNKFDVFENTLIDIFVETNNFEEAQLIVNSKPEELEN